MDRRRFLRNASVASAASVASVGLLGWPALTRAANRDPRFVLVILRGGLDGLAAIAPYGDKRYRSARGEAAMDRKDLLPLDGFFGTHPSLVGFQQSFIAGEALVVHALASPYRDRSHFDAQNVLELGLERPYSGDPGWLNRALQVAPQHPAIAIAPSLPLVLRGPQAVSSWSPETLPDPGDDIMSRLLDLYDTESVLGPRLRAGLATDELAGVEGRSMRGSDRANAALPIDALVRFLTHPDGPRVAVLEVGGWDTHANQNNQLNNRLRALDRGLANLKAGLGEAWDDTVVVAISEFGRTVSANGTRGTDHGTAGVALLLGGAVNGGRVIADWPGLAPADLYQGRDLQPTLDVRALFAALLHQHLQVSDAEACRIFPGLKRQAAFDTLIS